jgi:D-xylose transport system substrate-binding protein
MTVARSVAPPRRTGKRRCSPANLAERQPANLRRTIARRRGRSVGKETSRTRRRPMPSRPIRRAAWLAVIALSLTVAACGGGNSSSSESGGGSSSTPSAKAGKIALLLPESKTTRYETQDRPNFERKVHELCAECSIFYQNADQDPAKQQRQVEAAITQGADVIVLDPVNSDSASALAQRAKDRGIPVISYDRLITDAPLDYYISFDNERVGRLQAQSLIGALKKQGDADGSIVMINGAPTDHNAALFKQGAHAVLDDSSVKVAKEYDTPDWSPDAAQREMEQAISALGRKGFDGVYAANDGTAGGAIAALKGAGLQPSDYPVTGQDAELAAIQRIIAGEQYMTVYKAIKQEAEDAAKLAVAALRDESPPEGLVTGKTDNGQAQIPSALLTPVAVTKDNVQETVVADGFWSADQICTGRFKDDCQEVGLG